MRVSARWVRGFYNLCFPFVFLLMLPAYLRRMVRRGDYRRHFGQRFGWYSPETRARLRRQAGALWLQAVSVGEMLVALKLIAALRALDASLPIVLSTTTTTGFRLAEQQAADGVEVIYTPIDLRGAVRRAFDAIRPRRVIVVDGGLWPNLLWEARRRGVPTALVNARLSPRSERRFRRLRVISEAFFSLLDLVCVAEPVDIERWRALGVPSGKIRHTGSIKYDDPPSRSAHAAPVSLLARLGILPDAPVLFAGSTHPGEEKLIAGVFLRLRSDFPDLILLAAPRHVERTAEVRSELSALGLRVTLRTSLNSSTPPAVPHPDALLLDTTGELRDWYAVATLVVIGKSFTAVGGQNPAEAIAARKPVIFGPHMENFQDLVHQLLVARAAVQVGDGPALEEVCRRLLADPAERSRLAETASAQVAVHRGAARRTAALLLDAP